MSEALIVTDGRAGNVRQARALARAVDLQAAEVVADLRAPFSQVAPRLPRMGGLALRNSAELPTRPPWPALVIGCGRRAAWVTRWLKRKAGRRIFCVQILDPRINSKHWDLLITPRHDRTTGDNVLTLTGALNPVDSVWLAGARAHFPHLADLAAPRVALLLGGPRRGVRFDEHLQEALLAGVTSLTGARGSVLLCASQRTPAGFADSLRRKLADRVGRAWLGERDGPNPYPGYLAWADRIVVTPDSVNMLSEAAACGVPVHTRSGSGLPPRLAHFHQELRDAGWLHDLEAADALAPPQPLRETGKMGALLRARLREHVPNHALIRR